MVALVLDVTYQLIVHRWMYPLESLVAITALAIVPYIIVRGPLNRILILLRRHCGINFARNRNNMVQHENEFATQASPAEEPVSAIRKYIEAFNKGDAEGIMACFAVPGSILDGMPPHLWTGPTAAGDWYRDVLREAAHHGATGFFVTLRTPLHPSVTGNSAYVVTPATMTFKLQRQAGHAIGRDLYGRAPQVCGWVAHRGLGVGQGQA
jgi:hypothetical protein